MQRPADLASTVGAPLYVVHTSSEQALLAALRHRRDDVAVHIEACPHYLSHDVSWPCGVMGKINPPLREASDREVAAGAALRRYRQRRDRSCASRCHRQGGRHLGSVAGLSRPRDPVAVLLTEGHQKRGMPLERVADVSATAPARLMGLGQSKGSIIVGYDAYLTCVDLGKPWRLERSDVVSSAGYSIYEGWLFQGRSCKRRVARPVCFA